MFGQWRGAQVDANKPAPQCHADPAIGRGAHVISVAAVWAQPCSPTGISREPRPPHRYTSDSLAQLIRKTRSHAVPDHFTHRSCPVSAQGPAPNHPGKRNLRMNTCTGCAATRHNCSHITRVARFKVTRPESPSAAERQLVSSSSVFLGQIRNASKDEHTLAQRDRDADTRAHIQRLLRESTNGTNACKC